MKFSVLATCFVICWSTFSFGQTFRQKIDSLYGFKLIELKPTEVEKKMNQLDAFWQELNFDTVRNLPLIRNELKTAGKSAYFYFDMASYLEMHAMTKANKLAIEKALTFIQWKEIGTWELLDKLRDFGAVGIDITPVALQLLDSDKLKLTNAETGEVFNQGKVLAYLFLPLKADSYLSKLNASFDVLKPEAQRSLVTLFWLTNTKFANDRLEEISKNKRAKAVEIEVKSYADRLLRRFPVASASLVTYDAMDENARATALNAQYKALVTQWTTKSWSELIEYSKLMHHYKIVAK